MTRPAPRALLLDLAGVLSFFDKEGRLRRMAAAADLPEEEVTARIYGSGLVADADAGRLTADEMRTQLQRRLHLPGDVVDELWLSAVAPDPAALAALAHVDPALPRGLLTNNDALLADLLPRRYPELVAGMDPVAFAGVLGVTKPDPAAYLRPLAAWPVEPADVLFLDDSADNVDGARAAGLRAEQVAGAEELAAALRASGLVEPSGRADR